MGEEFESPTAVTDQLSAEAVTWGYRSFLDREPEDDAAVQRAMSYGSVKAFRQAVFKSEEFAHRSQRPPNLLPLNVLPIEVEWDAYY
jgi:hypothetical protein